MPQVEKNYRVPKDRNRHAISGLSMGGAEALYTGLNHLYRFAWVASLSGAFVMWSSAPSAGTSQGAGASADARRPMRLDPAVFPRTFPALDKKASAQLRLLWISCGAEDGLLGVNREFKEWLKTKEIQFKDVEQPGAHTWTLWRHNLA